MAAVTSPAGPPAWRVTFVVVVAVTAISFAAIFARLAESPGVVTAFWRLAFASLLLVPLSVRGWRRTRPTRASLAPALLAGGLLGVHFATWLSSLAYTTVAASVTLVTTTPLWVALLAWLGGRRPRRGALLGIGVALVGGAIIGLGDLRGGSDPLLGDLLALAGAIAAAGYFLAGRAAQRAGLGLNAYVGLAYGVAAVVLAPLPWVFGHPYFGWPPDTWAWILLMALAPQMIGHTGLNYAARHVDPTLVTTATLLEPVGASLLALVIFVEIPGPLVLLGAPVLLTGLALVIRHRHRERDA